MNAECEVDHREYGDGTVTEQAEAGNTTVHALYIIFMVAAFMIGAATQDLRNATKHGNRRIMQTYDGKFYVEEYQSWPHWQRITDDFRDKASARAVATNVFRMPKETK